MSTQASQLRLSPLEATHRRDWWAFVLDQAEPWHREHLRRLFEVWTAMNERWFDGELVPPYLLLAEPSTPTTYGDCSSVSAFGLRSQIRIRPSLLRGTHPRVRAGARYDEGRFLFVADVLRHEMLHQYAQEVSGKVEASCHGHGPAFRDLCNRIGEDLGLERVRTSKRRGKDAELPSCAQWPHNVRPVDYYQGAYVAPMARVKPTVPPVPPVIDVDDDVVVPRHPVELAASMAVSCSWWRTPS